MACASKTAKATLSLLRCAILLAGLLFLDPAYAGSSPSMDHTLNLLLQAQSAPDSARQSHLLIEAVKTLKHEKDAAGGHKERAITFARLAISDLKNSNASNVNDDLNQAIAEVRSAIAQTEGGSTSPQSPVVSVGPTQSTANNKLAEDQVRTRAVVLIKGDNKEGTGFLIKTADGPMVVTNIHVISDNPNLKITTSTGSPVTIVSYKGATDRDLAMIFIKDGPFDYLEMATDISGTVQSGDEVITPGNSEGGEVMLNTTGKVLAIGPDRIEFSNPVYHGNSGGPVIHVKSGKVIGVVTEAVKVDVSNALDKASFASRNSAIRNSMRYFGLRLDTVPKWEPYDWNRLLTETAFLDRFDKRSRCLDSYLNTPASDKKTEKKKSKTKDQDNQEVELYLSDTDIVKANNNFFSQAAGGSSSQRLDALRELLSDLNGIADADMNAIQNPNNFYTFDQQWAKDELAYRKALKTELDAVGNNVDRLGGLARKSN